MKIAALLKRIVTGLLSKSVSEACPVSECENVPTEYGDHGRLEIPALDIAVPLYNGGGGASQEIVDRQSSAAYMKWIEQDAIADHASQSNFINLQKAEPGVTLAYILYPEPEDAEEYLCEKIQIGHLKELGEGKGRRVFNADGRCAYFDNPGGLCIYTCRERSAPDVMDITLTYWRPVKE